MARHTILSDRFIRSLTDGRREITDTEVEARKKALGLDGLRGPFVVALVAADYAAVPYEQRDAAIQDCESYVERALSSVSAARFVYTDSSDRVVVLLAFGGQPIPPEQLNRRFIHLHEQLSARYGMQAFIGIGNVVDTYGDIPLSAATAQEMLGFKFRYADSGVVNAATIVKFQYSTSYGNGMEFERVISAFREGNLGRLESCLSDLAEAIRRRPNVSGTSIRRSMVEVTVHLLYVASNAGVDVEQALDDADPYRWIMRQNRTEVIIEWILRLSGRLLTMMQERWESGQKDVIRHALAFIEENLCSEELGLQQVSRAVGLSDTYFSQLFKKEVGTGINGYIARTRVERAMALLQDTSLSVADISRQLGFMSPGYFGQVFRKVSGTTPQQFRRRKAGLEK